MKTVRKQDLLDTRMLLKEANLIQAFHEHDLLRLRNRRAVRLSEAEIECYAKNIRKDFLGHIEIQVQARGILDVLAEVEAEIEARENNHKEENTQ